MSLTLMLAGAASATPGYGVEIAADGASANTDESGCVDFSANVTNSGSAPAPPQHSISLEADPGDSGWTIDPAPDSPLSLAPGETAPVTFGACAPADAEDGASATITLIAVVESDPGQGDSKASATADFTGTFTAMAGTQDNGTLFEDENETMDAANDTGDVSGESPGPGALLLAATAFGLIALARRRS